MSGRLDLLKSLDLDRLPRVGVSRNAAASAGPVYHLADGIILSIGPVQTRLIDITDDEEVPIDIRYVSALEHLALGWDMPGFAELIPQFVAAGFLAEGTPKPDSVLAETIKSLDTVFARLPDTPRVRAAHQAAIRAHARRKRFFEQVGQCPVLPETAVRRALTVGDANDVGVKKVLCVGDDDLVSIPLAMLGHDVTVFDIDDFLLRMLTDAAAEAGVKIAVSEVDLRDPMPIDLRGTFDVVLTDPMANRECFELFLSRSIALAKPDAQIFSAVFPPTTTLFKTVAAELGLAIETWNARHNRYYTHAGKLHWYESDWVGMRMQPSTQPSVKADDFSVPLNLYREDFAQRRPSFIGTFEEIEEVRFAMPLYLDLLVDVVEKAADVKLDHRVVHASEDFTVVHGTTDEGHMLIYVDRRTRVLNVELVPFIPKVEDALRHYIMNVYKPAPKNAHVMTSGNLWQVRIR